MKEQRPANTQEIIDDINVMLKTGRIHGEKETLARQFIDYASTNDYVGALVNKIKKEMEDCNKKLVATEPNLMGEFIVLEPSEEKRLNNNVKKFKSFLAIIANPNYFR